MVPPAAMPATPTDATTEATTVDPTVTGVLWMAPGTIPCTAKVTFANPLWSLTEVMTSLKMSNAALVLALAPVATWFSSGILLNEAPPSLDPNTEKVRAFPVTSKYVGTTGWSSVVWIHSPSAPLVVDVPEYTPLDVE